MELAVVLHVAETLMFNLTQNIGVLMQHGMPAVQALPLRAHQWVAILSCKIFD